jgi:hypothetical protein
MSRLFLFVLTLVAIVVASSAEAQVLGTFRWRTEPFCNVLNVTVEQVGAVYAIDGFDEQCGGNPRLPVHGIAVAQPNGTITLGLSVVTSPGTPTPVNLQAFISPGVFSGNWRDSAGNNGAFTFNPQGPLSGGPRPGAIPPSSPIPVTFSLRDDGGFLARGQLGQGLIPASGLGTRMMWYPKKAAFRAGQVTIPAWDDVNIGINSTAFGLNTVASGESSAAFGGETLAGGVYSLAAGFNTIAQGANSQAFGYFTRATGFASLSMGNGTQAIGAYSLAGGVNAIARGVSSMAFGNGETLQNGSFVWGDVSTSNKVVSDQPNQFIVRASGGFRFATNANQSTGVFLLPGANQFTQISDVSRKDHFEDLDGDEVLRRFARLPIREWSYTAQGPSIRHIGPTAQDFYTEFGLGEDPLGIGTLDASGVALAGVKALEARTREMNETLTRENEALREAIDTLLRRIEQLEKVRVGAP